MTGSNAVVYPPQYMTEVEVEQSRGEERREEERRGVERRGKDMGEEASKDKDGEMRTEER